MKRSSLVLYKKNRSGTYTFYDSVTDSTQQCQTLYDRTSSCWDSDSHSSFRLDLIDAQDRVVSSKKLTPTQDPTESYF